MSRTYEIGARGGSSDSFSWNAALFRTDLRDDIQFISSQNIQRGYFDNVGNTRRQGIEMGGRYRIGNVQLGAFYTYLKATFQTPFVVNSPNNSAATDINGDTVAGEIQVNRGNRIPGLPEHSVKFRVDYAANDAFSVGSNIILNSECVCAGRREQPGRQRQAEGVHAGESRCAIPDRQPVAGLRSL